MELKCNPEVAAHLKSPSQRTRIITEDCFSRFGCCLKRSSNALIQTRAGTVCQDFYCPKCGQPYELKSAKRAHTNIVQDGGYNSTMRCIQGDNVPALMLMHYSPEWQIQGLLAIHPIFLTPNVVMKRQKPHIRPKSKAKYWMCDLNLAYIPADGKIVLVTNGKINPPKQTRQQFQGSARFKDVKLAERLRPPTLPRHKPKRLTHPV